MIAKPRLENSPTNYPELVRTEKSIDVYPEAFNTKKKQKNFFRDLNSRADFINKDDNRHAKPVLFRCFTCKQMLY